MGCVNPDGSITTSARQMLKLLREPHTPEAAATEAEQPLFKVRSSLREMIDAGLVTEDNGLYSATDAGLELIADD